MPRKTNEQLIQDQIDGSLVVKDLIKALSEIDPEMPVGVAGHFGNILLLNKYAFEIKTGYLTPSGFWRDNNQREIKFLSVEAPDIGPDPD